MIARVWSGSTRSEDAEAYEAYVRRTGVAALAATPGNLGVFLFRREQDDRATFVVLSLWDGMESVRRFAGEETDRAVYFEEDQRFLLGMPERVTHYDVPLHPGSFSIAS